MIDIHIACVIIQFNNEIYFFTKINILFWWTKICIAKRNQQKKNKTKFQMTKIK